jgi:hypothetical protein
MNQKGHIVMSRKTHENIKEPTAVQLFFDTVNNRIGIKPAQPVARDAFPLVKTGRHGGRVIRACRLMHEFGIELPQTIKFRDIMIDKDGILILDLRTASVVKRK